MIDLTAPESDGQLDPRHQLDDGLLGRRIANLRHLSRVVRHEAVDAISEEGRVWIDAAERFDRGRRVARLLEELACGGLARRRAVDSGARVSTDASMTAQ